MHYVAIEGGGSCNWSLDILIVMHTLTAFDLSVISYIFQEKKIEINKMKTLLSQVFSKNDIVAFVIAFPAGVDNIHWICSDMWNSCIGGGDGGGGHLEI